MGNYKNILVEKKGSVATLRLNRIEVHNALNFEMISELRSAIKAINTDEEIRFIVFQGNGKSFCSGADISWFRDIPNLEKKEALLKLKKLPGLLLDIYKSPKVTITVIHGSIMGGGIGLTAACDFVVGEPDCKFAFGEVKLGIVPATISPFVVQKMGREKAKQLMLTGENFDGLKAFEVGLISHFVKKGKLEEKLQGIIRELSNGSPNALKQIKQSMNLISEEEVNVKTELLYNLLQSEEGKEGITAFFEKRKSHWNQ